jgi:hypothetical protein
MTETQTPKVITSLPRLHGSSAQSQIGLPSQLLRIESPLAGFVPDQPGIASAPV